jgi:hypothetical protein
MTGFSQKYGGELVCWVVGFIQINGVLFMGFQTQRAHMNSPQTRPWGSSEGRWACSPEAVNAWIVFQYFKPTRFQNEDKGFRKQDSAALRMREAFESIEIKGFCFHLCDTRPNLLVGSSEHAENTEELVDLRVSGEQGPPHDKLRKDATNRPDVDGCGVVLGSEEDLRRTVPESNNLNFTTADFLVSIIISWQTFEFCTISAGV